MFFVSMQDELVARYVPDAKPPAATAEDGRTLDAGSRETVAHAKRVAEGVSLEIHRNTWRYSKPVEVQRRIVLEQRDRVLRTDAALRALASRCPDRFAAWPGRCAGSCPTDGRAPAARRWCTAAG